MPIAVRAHTPRPDWLRVKMPGGENYLRIKSLIRGLKLHTVCEEAHCPNVAECWGGGTATLMLLGDTCTRACRFCSVKTGIPNGKVDLAEPHNVAQAVKGLGLSYVVLTSVDRDDLKDGGADHFARTVEAIKELNGSVIVEVLIPDFRADRAALNRISNCGAEVIAHNIETVERLTSRVRDRRATYRRSLEVLSEVRKTTADIYTKSSLMVGLGETADEVLTTMDDLRGAGVEILTIGQYLRPSQWHLPVDNFIPPGQFYYWEQLGKEKGFLYVVAGPLVRSSYRAGEIFLKAMIEPKLEAQHAKC